MAVGDVLSVVFRRESTLPNQLRHKVLLTKDLITDAAQVMLLMVINRDKDHAVFREELSCQREASMDHRAPVGVKARLGSLVERKALARTVDNASCLLKVFSALMKFVLIDEICTGVIGRVDVDHLDGAAVTA